MRGLLSIDSLTDSIGFGPVHTITLLTDGALEPLDVLRIAGYKSTCTPMNILSHTFQDVLNDPAWRSRLDASLNLCEVCEGCVYRDACGGGHLAHRWSKKAGYNNPSAYCNDLKLLFNYVWQRMAREMILVTEHGDLPLLDALSI
jgi:uncharacterized protein